MATTTAPNNELSSALSQLLSNSLVEVLEALETLLVYTKNLIQYPDEKKYRKIKISNIHYQERLGHLPGAQDAMTAIGYVPSGDYLKLDEKRIKQDGNDQVLRQLKAHIEQHLEQVKKTWTNLPLRLDNSHTYSSVQGAGYYSAIGKRHNMEDDEIIVDHFCGDAQQGYFGLYDGHGGRATVDFVVKALHMNLEHELKRHPNNNISEAFRRSYLSTDGQLRRQNILRSGSTSVTCVIKKFGAKRFLFTANVGDSRAVLCRGGRAIRLTIDHKASLPEEAKRITDAGGFIGRNRRVNGVLAISRALGDHMLKENDVVSAVPHCADTELTDEDSFLLLACDGVWDVMSDQEAIDFMLAKIKSFEQTMLENQATAKNAAQETKEQPNGTSTESIPNGIDTATAASTTSTSASSADSSASSSTSTSASSSSSSSSSSTSTSNGSASTATSTISTTASTTAASSSADPEATHGPATLFSPPIATSAANSLSTTGGYGPGGKEPSGKMKTINDVLDQTSKALVAEALERRSLDNVTVMIIKL